MKAIRIFSLESVAGKFITFDFGRFFLLILSPTSHETAVMGDAVNRTTRGTFYLKTRDRSRFALPAKDYTNCEINNK